MSGRAGANAQAGALADSEEGQPLVLADHGAVCVGDGTRGKASGKAAAKLGPEIAVDEAQVLRLRLRRGSEAECCRLGADVCLGLVVPEDEHGALQLTLIEPVQHVGLVAARIACPMEGGQRTSAAGTRVMPGGKMRRARGTGALEEHPELDALVAANAGIGGYARRIAGFEVAHHLLLEIALEIPDVMRQRERGGNSPGVIDGVDRAAPAIANDLARCPPTLPA